MEAKKDLKFIFFALMAFGQGISGGDKISIEFVRRWSKEFSLTVYLWEEGYRMYLRQNLNPKKIKFKIVNMSPWRYMGFFINYIARILTGVLISFKIRINNDKNTIVYSATEFWMDSMPALFLKLRFPKITWIATWFQTAPNPWMGFKEGDWTLSSRFSALYYWLVQLPIKPLIKRWANFVLVNNDSEKVQFPRLNKQNKVIVVYGALDIKKIMKWKSEIGNLPKIYDACFQGRFHPQKGALELIDIWKLVVDKKRDAKLVMIGDGPLMESVKEKVKREKLEKNIKLTGYLFDGEEKYRIFSQSKIVIHPAIFDSGGMASMEAMAFGLPCVGFNLSSYKYYYPKGMVKVKIGDLQEFADKILELISNIKLYQKLKIEALDLVTHNHSWDFRSRQILTQVLK